MIAPTTVSRIVVTLLVVYALAVLISKAVSFLEATLKPIVITLSA